MTLNKTYMRAFNRPEILQLSWDPARNRGSLCHEDAWCNVGNGVLRPLHLGARSSKRSSLGTPFRNCRILRGRNCRKICMPFLFVWLTRTTSGHSHPLGPPLRHFQTCKSTCSGRCVPRRKCRTLGEALRYRRIVFHDAYKNHILRCIRFMF